ncbi:glycosyltransferase family 39 protein [Tumebacillus sp. ITR2]|uniref:Glycosyltransferase family 39 protein n=1 Tax=Tumebacillus amylolyticus TaxID=2801339 RepID=A0ABS1J9H0_9BACL|nr:glycosyltransferase family 39 protein [Tumebacillus amylolyticus]MBL0386928.1 glycosyltransferase family 39 protein [Tumebacillus amylolyticus]
MEQKRGIIQALTRVQLLLIALIMLLGLILRVVMILHHPDRPITIYDDMYYIKSAQRLLEAGIFTFGFDVNLPTVFIPPVFPLYLAGVFAVFGSGEVGLTVAQYSFAVIGTLAIGMTALLGAVIKRPYAGIVGALIYAVYPPTILSSIVFLTESMFTLGMLAFFVVLIRAIQTHRTSLFIWAGVLLGITTLTRPTIALVPAVVGLYLWFRADYGFKKAFRVGVLLVATLFLVLSPWIIRNYVDFHQFIPLTKASGNPFLTGTYLNHDVWSGGHDPQFKDLPVGWKRVPGDQIATNDLLMEMGKQRLQAEFSKHPKEMLQWYTIGKFRAFWSRPFDWRETLVGDFQVLIPIHKYLVVFGALGMFVSVLRKQEFVWLLVLFFAYFTGVHMVYVTLPRYALPLLPILFLFVGMLLPERNRVVE